jgi:hypothetical protein
MRQVSPPDWSEVRFETVDLGVARHNRRLRFKGVWYATQEESTVAKILTLMRIPFTPNVEIRIPGEAGSRGQTFVPDFIFDGAAYLWQGREVIHGIEAKNGKVPPKTVEKVALLARRLGIRVKVLRHRDIARFVRRGRFPLRPL